MARNNLKDLMKPLMTPIHSEGYIFIAIFAIITVVMSFLFAPLFFIGLVLTVWCIYFFRDPARYTPTDPWLVISPADGVLQTIDLCAPPPELKLDKKQKWTRLAIFMNVFDVHVNRSPIAAKILKKAYVPGKFFSANLDKAAAENERQLYLLAHEPALQQEKGPKGKGAGADSGPQSSDHEVIMVQIAGLVARRIVCDVDEGQDLLSGQRVGMIRFGSRVDIYLPTGTIPQVAVGQRMIAGETILAHLPKAAKGAKAKPEGPQVIQAKVR